MRISGAKSLNQKTPEEVHSLRMRVSRGELLHDEGRAVRAGRGIQ